VQIRAILFDYGGTLDGPASHWLDRFVALYRAAGCRIDFAPLKDAFYRADAAAYADARVAAMSLRELMAFHVGVQLAALGVVDPALERRLIDEFVLGSEAALAGSRKTLARLARRYRLGVVSNFYGNVERILADAGIASLLTVIADSNRVGAMKPDQRIFAHALERLGTMPEETLHVGDSHERDVRAARALGLRTAWLVPPDRHPSAPDPDADLVISSLNDLEHLLIADRERRADSLSREGEGQG
jgi:putative hydrolase of the HAD superfamily